MASLSEQLRDGIKIALLAAPQIPEVLTRVERGREDPHSERENGSINIRAEDEQSRVFSEELDDNEMMVEIEIYVVAAQGIVWETLADTILVAMHARIMAYGGWSAILARVRKASVRWAGEPGNRTPGLLTVRYAFRFLSRANAVDAKP